MHRDAALDNAGDRGGSAVDAAIAAQLVLTLVEPQSSGIGGGAFLMHWERQTPSTVEAYDGREKAPMAAGPDLFLQDPDKHADGLSSMRSWAGARSACRV